MRSHLHHIWGVTTNKEVPPIWADVAASKTQFEGLALIDLFLGQGMDYCNQVYGGHTVILHISLPLYHRVSKGRFDNVDLNKSCLAGGHSVWTHLQGSASRGEAMAKTAVTVQALDFQLATDDLISCAICVS